ncbi:MAG: hypothetical protein Q4F83_10930 [Eubacteriales bacterium]|nr:hypothetical protein [Eubacteriales bacterium]
MRKWQYLRTYAAVMTGLFLGVSTAAMIGRQTEIIEVVFTGIMMFALGASGFMAMTEGRFGRVQLYRKRKKRASQPVRRFQTYTLEGEIVRIPVKGAPDLVEIRNVVARK